MTPVAKKTRTDAWGEDFSEELREELYALTLPPAEEDGTEGRPRLRDFRTDVLPYLAQAGLAPPSRSAWYRFLGRCREAKAAERIISIETSRRIAMGFAKANVAPKTAFEVCSALSMDAAARGDDAVMKVLADAAAKYAAIDQGERKIALELARQKTSEEQLRLAREKFEFDAAKAAMEKAAQIRAISADESLSADAKIAAVRTALFGEAAG